MYLLLPVHNIAYVPQSNRNVEDMREQESVKAAEKFGCWITSFSGRGRATRLLPRPCPDQGWAGPFHVSIHVATCMCTYKESTPNSIIYSCKQIIHLPARLSSSHLCFLIKRTSSADRPTLMPYAPTYTTNCLSFSSSAAIVLHSIPLTHPAIPELCCFRTPLQTPTTIYVTLILQSPRLIEQTPASPTHCSCCEL